MTMIKPPQADGLYDPRYEHDACGVAMVARLDDVPAPRRRRRGRSRRSTTSSTAAPRAPTSSTGDGAGHPASRCPTRSSAPSSASSCPPAGQLRRRRLLPARATRRCARKLEELIERNVARRGPARPRLARRAGRRGPRRRDRQRARARTSASSSSAPAPALAGDQDAFERKLYVIRRVVELAAGPDFYVAELLLADDRLQGDAHRAARSRGFFPDLQDERVRERAGARPLALLDEHLPELGAGPPVPRDRPQRRDQHAEGNVNWMRARECAARLRALRRRPRRRSCRSSGPAARTRPRSTTCSSCSCSPAARCRTR